MSRHILVLRHAQAVSEHAGGDFERRLTDRGIKQAQQVAAHFQAIAWQPELALVSSARRTMQTAEIIASHHNNMQIIADRTLYLATGIAMIDALSSMPDSINNILLVGHNPGISEVVSLLTGKQTDALPTAGHVLLHPQIGSWKKLHVGCAQPN